ncbi:MAG TPA: Gfo/Idh/MocA family oxidoreductase [Saprospiraceae bacterium]|nr:Gfo/Idh/MocA family oxidoreductase [Saprospiraceae bacterium]
MQNKIKWGILGCGKIALKFAADLAISDGGYLYAVASTSKDKQKIFSDIYPDILTFDSYEDLAACAEIDAIYVATPHAFHMTHSTLCLEYGKAVLCEKPMALNSDQVQKMIDTARAHKVFLMEAMWTAFLPAIQYVIHNIQEGTIGVVKHISADFGFKAVYDAKSRLFDLHLAGGSLLDIGLYPVMMALLVLGEPTSITASAQLAPTGADESCTMLLTYANGATASLFCTLGAHTDTKCEIYGSEGKITIPGRFHEQDHYLIKMGQGDETKISVGKKGLGYAHEIEHVASCLQEGKTESPIMDFDMSTTLIRILDEIRRQIGVKYPADYHDS